MSEYVLDVSKWRCGGSDLLSDNALGEGETFLLNSEGYMCCLGQFAKHVGVDEADLIQREEPNDVGQCYDPSFVSADHATNGTTGVYNYANTNLAHDLMVINDNCATSPKRKIKGIRAKLEEHGHSLIVINEWMLEELSED